MKYAPILTSLEQAITEATPHECPVLLGELERLKGVAWGRIMVSHQTPVNQPVSELGRYLTVDEVSERFHVTAKWLYRHKRQMPHSQPSRKVLLFPEQAITKWFASRKQA